MSTILTHNEDGILLVSINRPERMNALDDDAFDMLEEIFSATALEASVGAVVLTGIGKAFCAGGDVKGMASRGPQSFEQKEQRLRRKQRLPLLIRKCPKVVIAAMNGVAVGAGMSLALACDLRIAARSASLVTGFRDVALSGDLGASWLLTSLVGTGKARELMLLGGRINAETAREIGLVTAVCEDEALMMEARAIASQISEGPRLALCYMKQNLMAAEELAMMAALDQEASNQARVSASDDHEEAKNAFMQRRKPVFRGS